MTDKNRHDCFIGRWVNFHKGHLAIIEKVYNKNKKPILILVMDTNEKPIALERKLNINNILAKHHIECEVIVIPPISSVNWGRKVGYDRNYIEVDEVIQEISGTKIREKIESGEDWEGMVP